MTNTELVFFMGCTTVSNQKVISVRSRKSDRPSKMPTDSPIYTRNITSCGTGLIQFHVTRPLDPTGNPLAQGSEYVIKVGQSIDMIVAASYSKFSTFSGSNTPDHTKSKGFDSSISFLINENGSISNGGVDLY